MTTESKWHGTTYGYSGRLCRCPFCSEAVSKYSRTIRERRRTQRVEVDGKIVHLQAPHGTNGGYVNWLCRCHKCTEAHSTYQSAWRRKQRTKHGLRRNP